MSSEVFNDWKSNYFPAVSLRHPSSVSNPSVYLQLNKSDFDYFKFV